MNGVTHNGRHLYQQTAADPVALGRESSTLFVGQPEPPAPQLLLQDPTFLDQVGEHVARLPVHPPFERREQELDREVLAWATF